MEESVEDIIARTKEIVKNADSLLDEIKASDEGVDFLINEYKTNKRYFCETGNRPTINDVIKTAFEFGWASHRNYMYDKNRK